MDDVVTYVLVHSPLVGRSTWQPVAEALRRRGHPVVVPRLDNELRVDLPLWRHHAEQVRRSVEAAVDEGGVVLVGHSGAGAILPAIGDALVHPVMAYVFVDSELPRDGVCRVDLAPPEFAQRLERLADEGMLPPWAEWWGEGVLAALVPDDALREQFAAELRPLPVALFEERIRVPAGWPDAPCAYLQLSGPYDEAAARAKHEGWEVGMIEAGHLHMLADPDEVARAIVDLASRFTAAPPRGRDEAGAEATDAVTLRRRRIARYVEVGRRVGFAALAIAVALFAVALYWGLPRVLLGLIIAGLAVSCLTLLPAIVLGYGLSAAEREDRERGRHPPST